MHGMQGGRVGSRRTHTGLSGDEGAWMGLEESQSVDEGAIVDFRPRIIRLEQVCDQLKLHRVLSNIFFSRAI